MKLLSFEKVIEEERRQHLGALVDGDADSGLVSDLTAALKNGTENSPSGAPLRFNASDLTVLPAIC